MRVISGAARGTRLARVPTGTRPLSDRAREGLFSSLGGRVGKARCADLFAGTGAVGIEALSRGAPSCAFVDSSPAAIRAIRDNLGRTGLAERAQVARGDVRRSLSRPGEPFDLVFLDPPYRLPEAEVREALEALGTRLARGAIVALTRPSRNSTSVIPVDWSVIRRLAYGDTHVLLCREGE
jgi:16S rRNA (guanine966-N2)-methyltransferase